MQIVKGPIEQKFPFTCTGKGNGGDGCGAELIADRDDLRYFPEQEHPWRIAPEAVVAKCPCCGITTDFPKSEWPPQAHRLTPWSSEWRNQAVS